MAGPAVVSVGRLGEPGCQRLDVLDKLRGFVDLEIEPFGCHVDGQLLQRVGPGPQGADLLLTNVMLYWLTGTAGSSANSYYETAHA